MSRPVAGEATWVSRVTRCFRSLNPAGDLGRPAHQEGLKMSTRNRAIRGSVVTLSVVSALALGGCGAMQKLGLGGDKPTSVALTGAQEVPPVSTRASGRSTIAVASDRTVSGSVIVDDMKATAAHIHQGAAGTNGPVIIPLTRTSDTVFSVPRDTRLNDQQYAAYKAGNLYINVHSSTYPNGEIRVQLKP